MGKSIKNLRLFIPIIILIALVSTNLLSSPSNEVTEDVPVLGSYKNLKNIIGYKNKSFVERIFGTDFTMAKNSVDEAASPAQEDSGSSENDYSSTNVQVKGVDEADIIKTDGQYIYTVNNEKLTVVKVGQEDNMSLSDSVRFDNDKFYPSEMYLDNRYLIVLGHTYRDIPLSGRTSKSADIDGEKAIDLPYYRHSSTLKAIVYDISDKTNLKNVREVEIEGNYVSSRKVDSVVYLVTNKYLDYYYINEIARNKVSEDDIAPSYRDTVDGEDFNCVDFNDIRYFPESVDSNFLIIASFDLNNMKEEVKLSTYLGSGQNIYMSKENLFVAVNKYEEVKTSSNPFRTQSADVAVMPGIGMPRPSYNSNTLVYKFSLNNGDFAYEGKGEVPGHIINQFSMDEYENHFRIATTSGEMWRNDELTSKNNVYILDQNLKISGKIENIAPGERIYSVRFMGEKGYMVTFKTVDPLFVLDLKNPKAPKILGELKIPGYSDYLHPYDENHIIGFGKDAIEMPVKDHNGKVVGTNAYYLGMKIALFDVSDVNNPKEKFVEMIGDRGTESEILRNHKALLFSREKGLLALPVTVMEVRENDGQYRDPNFPPYGSFSFQGAYVYKLTLENGFELRGKISHMDNNANNQRSDYYWYNYEDQVQRIIYIDDTLYTMSPSFLKANDMDTLKEKATLKIR